MDFGRLVASDTLKYMGASSLDLQRQIANLQHVLPTLMPHVAPKQIRELLQHGLSLQGPLVSLKTRQKVMKALGGIERCQVCGRPGTPSLEGCSSSSSLILTVMFQTDAAERSVRVDQARVLCGICRCWLEVEPLVHHITTRLRLGDEERLSSFRRLCLHLAGVNNVPQAVTSCPDGLDLWAQEVVSRVYAMNVVLSNLNGWRLMAPDGAALSVLTEESASHLMVQLAEAAGRLAGGVGENQNVEEGPRRRRRTSQAGGQVAAPVDRRKKKGGLKVKKGEGAEMGPVEDEIVPLDVGDEQALTPNDGVVATRKVPKASQLRLRLHPRDEDGVPGQEEGSRSRQCKLRGGGQQEQLVKKMKKEPSALVTVSRVRQGRVMKKKKKKKTGLLVS